MSGGVNAEREGKTGYCESNPTLDSQDKEDCTTTKTGLSQWHQDLAYTENIDVQSKIVENKRVESIEEYLNNATNSGLETTQKMHNVTTETLRNTLKAENEWQLVLKKNNLRKKDPKEINIYIQNLQENMLKRYNQYDQNQQTVQEKVKRKRSLRKHLNKKVIKAEDIENTPKSGMKSNKSFKL
jgi:DNA-binding protein YbaB